MVNSPELAPPAPIRRLQKPNPRGTNERTVGFDKMTDGTGTSILQSALRRQQKKMENEEGKALRDPHRDTTRKQKKEDQSVANLEYLESLHKRANRKRQKDEDDLPPKDTPPQDSPPDPPPPFRDKGPTKLGEEEKSNRGAEKSREKSRLVTGPHETVPPR